MSFKEFDMTEYYNVLEEFKTENKDKVIRQWGSVDKFDEFIERVKTKETEIAKDAIKQYGSIKKYAYLTLGISHYLKILLQRNQIERATMPELLYSLDDNTPERFHLY